jgi:hypothetical protein
MMFCLGLAYLNIPRPMPTRWTENRHPKHGPMGMGTCTWTRIKSISETSGSRDKIELGPIDVQWDNKPYFGACGGVCPLLGHQQLPNPIKHSCSDRCRSPLVTFTWPSKCHCTLVTKGHDKRWLSNSLWSWSVVQKSWPREIHITF